MRQRAVFLDRDGVINRAMVREGKPYPPANSSELELLPGTAEALWALRNAGFLLIVVTNQPDVARGITSRETVETIHARLLEQLPLDAIRTCYHDNGDGCDCRKPRPGALLSVADEYSIDLSRSYMVGDRWRDMEAGQRAGCKTIFLDYGYNEKQPNSFDHKAMTLTEAVQFILMRSVS